MKKKLQKSKLFSYKADSFQILIVSEKTLNSGIFPFHVVDSTLLQLLQYPWIQHSHNLPTAVFQKGLSVSRDLSTIITVDVVAAVAAPCSILPGPGTNGA